MECLKQIVGVIKSDCACLVDKLDAGVKEKLAASKSGLYLDDLPGGIELKVLDNLGACQAMADMALKALDNAAMTTKADLITALSGNFTKALNTFRGMLGQMSYNDTMTPTKKYQAYVMRAGDNRDAVAIINRIMLNVSGAATPLDIKIYRAPRGSFMGTELASYPLVVSPNNFATANMPGPLRLPMYIDGQAQDYYFFYDCQAVVLRPKNNKIDCGCPSATISVIGSYIQQFGLEFDDVENLTGGNKDKYMHGFVIDAELVCDSTSIMCGEFDRDEAVAIVLAYAIWYKAGELLIHDVLKSNEVNRYTLQNNQYLWQSKTEFARQYAQRIEYLSEVVDLSNSDCYVCKQSVYMSHIAVTDGSQQDQSDAIEAIQGTPSVPGVIPYPPNY